MKLILAHRGFVKLFKDNTIKSFSHIFNYKNTNKYNLGIELDVNLTQDDKLIVYHDEYIKDTKINDLSYKVITSIDKDIPLLDEVLSLFNNTNYYIDIELKEYPINKAKYCDNVLDIVSKYNINYFISSFNNSIVTYLRCKNNKVLLLGKNADIVHYTDDITKETKGVYTLHDKDFKDIYIAKVKDLDIIISDDLDSSIALFC